MESKRLGFLILVMLFGLNTISSGKILRIEDTSYVNFSEPGDAIVIADQLNLDVSSGEPEDLFRMANELYIDSRFEEAIDLYEEILDSGYHSAELYYNLGNACYRSNKIPDAILNYERALLLSPGDEDIRFNRELARMHIRDRVEELPGFFMKRWWASVRDLFSAGEWASASAAFFIIFLLMVTGFLIVRSVNLKRIFFWNAVILIIASALSISFGIDKRNHIRNHDTAIVFAPVVSVKSSPDINSTELFVIHEGTKVWIEDSIGHWREIRLSDGNKGWLPAESVEEI